MQRSFDDDFSEDKVECIELKSCLGKTKHHTDPPRLQTVQSPVASRYIISTNHPAVQPNTIRELGHLLDGIRVVKVDNKVGSEVSRHIRCKIQTNVAVVNSDDPQAPSFGKLDGQHAEAANSHNCDRLPLFQPSFFDCIPYGGLEEFC